jgi:hypothetical protein
VASLRQFFLWTQGQVQALLPHQVMVALQFAPLGRAAPPGMPARDRAAAAGRGLLADRRDGLALRIARHCRRAGGCRRWPTSATAAMRRARRWPVSAEIAQEAGFDNVLVHGTGACRRGASVFVLFGLPMRPGPRHAYFLECCWPICTWRCCACRHRDGRRPHRRAAARPLSAREAEIVGLAA